MVDRGIRDLTHAPERVPAREAAEVELGGAATPQDAMRLLDVSAEDVERRGVLEDDERVDEVDALVRKGRAPPIGAKKLDVAASLAARSAATASASS